MVLVTQLLRNLLPSKPMTKLIVWCQWRKEDLNLLFFSFLFWQLTQCEHEVGKIDSSFNPVIWMLSLLEACSQFVSMWSVVLAWGLMELDIWKSKRVKMSILGPTWKQWLFLLLTKSTVVLQYRDKIREIFLLSSLHWGRGSRTLWHVSAAVAPPILPAEEV